jgi:hypothetical protein
MKIDGGCHCGAITYEAEVDPDKVTVCHCTDCQTLSGSAFRVVVLTDRFRLLGGEPKIYVKTGESGRKRVQSFCANCGTPIYSADAAAPEVYSIRLGTVRQRAELPPKVQIWCRSALPWTMNLGPVTQVAKQNF